MDTNGAIALIATTNFQHQPRITRINTNFCFREAGAAATANVFGSAREQPSQLLRLAKGHAHLKSSGFGRGGLPKPPGRLGSIALPIFSFLRSHGAVRVWDWGAYASSSATGPHTGRIRPKAKRIRRGERVSRCVSRRLSSLN